MRSAFRNLQSRVAPEPTPGPESTPEEGEFQALQEQHKAEEDDGEDVAFSGMERDEMEAALKHRRKEHETYKALVQRVKELMAKVLDYKASAQAARKEAIAARGEAAALKKELQVVQEELELALANQAGAGPDPRLLVASGAGARGRNREEEEK
ncbi:unnamed protein product, partial [Chrysoparadoxa australica]